MVEHSGRSRNGYSGMVLNPPSMMVRVGGRGHPRGAGTRLAVSALGRRYDRDVQDPRITPLRIDADRAAGSLTVGWADGHATAYDTVTLRWLCPCAYCRGEAGLPGWLDSNPTLTPEQTQAHGGDR